MLYLRVKGYSAKMKEILITGSFCSLNNGDLAMCYGFRNMMESLGRFNYTVLSMYPYTEPERYGARVVGVPTSPRIRFGLNLVKNIIASTIYRLSGGRIRGIWGKEFNAFLQSDLIVDLSGDGYSDEITPLGSIVHSLMLLPAIILNKKLFICAQSLGPFNKCYTRLLSRFILENASLLTVREKITKSYLESVGVKREVLITADCAFGMDPSKNEIVKKWHNKIHRWKNQGHLVICISLSKRVSRFVFQECSNQDQRYEYYVETMANIIDELVAKYNCKVIFLPHVLGPSLSDDRLTHRDIMKHIEGVEHVVCLEEPLRCDEMKGVISKAHCVLSARMHALIAAYSTGVPGVAVGYSHKYEGIIGEMFDMESLFVDVRFFKRDELKREISKRMDDLIYNMDYYRNKLNRSIPNIRTQSMENCKMAVKLLGGNNVGL